MAQKAPTLIFICDTCGVRASLDRTKRHWCEACRDSPVEMRCVKDRKALPLEVREKQSLSFG